MVMTEQRLCLAVVQISGASKKRRIDHCIIVLKGLPSKQKAQWYL
jgi:hypothetical protein